MSLQIEVEDKGSRPNCRRCSASAYSERETIQRPKGRRRASEFRIGYLTNTMPLCSVHR